MRTYSKRWLDAGAYFVSIFLACTLIWYVLPSDYRGGGGAVAFTVSIFALIFRFLFWLILGRVIEKHEEQRRDANHMAQKH
jgi:hypothetical protein